MEFLIQNEEKIIKLLHLLLSNDYLLRRLKMSLVDKLKGVSRDGNDISGGDVTFLFSGASRLDRAKALDNIKAGFTAYSGADWEKREEIIQGRLEQQIAHDGVKHFKRRALGLCGRSTTKTPDEMTRLLYETGVASSLEEAREILPFFGRKSACYEVNVPDIMVTFRYLLFNQIKDYSGNVSYKINFRFFISDD